MLALAEASGRLDTLSIIASSDDDLLEAVSGLQWYQYVRVVGPPNQSNSIGQDVDQLHILPRGAVYLQTIR